MADQNTTRLGILKMEVDSHDNAWGDLTNDNWDLADRAAAGWVTRSATGGTAALSQDNLVERYQRITGTLTSDMSYTIGAAVTDWWIFENATTGAFSLTVKVTGQVGVIIPQGEARVIRNNGTDVVATNTLPESVFNGKGQWLGTLSFSSDAYSAVPASYATYVTAYRDGLVFRAYINNANTTTTPTFNYNSLGAKTIVHSDGTALAVGELAVGMLISLLYHSTADKWYVTYTKAASTTSSGVISGALTLTNEVTPPTITVSPQNDYSPTGMASATTLFLSSNADTRQITGLATGSAGRVLILRNTGSFIIKLMHNSGSSSAANQMSLNVATGGFRQLLPGQIIVLYYRGDTSKWSILTYRHASREIDFGTYTGNSDLGGAQAHGLSTYPTGVEVYLECQTGDLNYAVGDRIRLGDQSYLTVFMNTTNVGVSTQSFSDPRIVNKNGNATSNPITNSRWHVIVKVFD